MLLTSGTYNFQSVEIELLIREAYERIGILGEFVEYQKLDSAKRSIDLIFLDWMNKSVNLWTLGITYLPLITSQSTYNLPVIVSDIIQASIRTSTRQLEGTATSSAGGTAANAFDGNPATACTQTAPNGNIQYNYGVDGLGNSITQKINFVGIQPNDTNLYNIVIENSLDGITWNTLLTQEINCVAGVNNWFDIITPTAAQYYRLRATTGTTLNIQELYFNNNINDILMSNISRYGYYSFSNRQYESQPNIYYLHRDITPVLHIYPTPSSQFNCMFYSYKQMIQDTGDLYTNTVEIPSRFYVALISRLAYELALKYRSNDLQYLQLLKSESDSTFGVATTEDSPNLSITIQPNYDPYR